MCHKFGDDDQNDDEDDEDDPVQCRTAQFVPKLERN